MTHSSYNGYKSIQDALEQGIEAVEGGDTRAGEDAFSWVLKKDPSHTAAWLWLACCAPEESAKRACYRNAWLTLN